MRTLCLLPLCLLAACTPIVNINVVPGQENLRPQTVLADANSSGGKVAMIDVRGVIMDSHTPGLLADGPNPVDRLAAQLDQASKDSSIKAVILRITSPGGTVTASDIMHQEVRRFEKETGKPVIASIGEIGTSGGYYLALAADRIYAEPTSITGSVGVIMPTMNFSEGLSKLGIKSISVKSGANKDLANPFEPVRDGQYAVLQGMVDEMYARFKGLVLERRKGLKPEMVAEATDGRIFMGEHAKAIGLIDEIGGVRECFAEAKRLAGLQGATLVKFADVGAPPRSAYSQSGTPTRESEINLVQLRLGAGFAAANDVAPFYYLWMPQ